MSTTCSNENRNSEFSSCEIVIFQMLFDEKSYLFFQGGGAGEGSLRPKRADALKANLPSVPGGCGRGPWGILRQASPEAVLRHAGQAKVAPPPCTMSAYGSIYLILPTSNEFLTKNVYEKTKIWISLEHVSNILDFFHYKWSSRSALGSQTLWFQGKKYDFMHTCSRETHISFFQQ